MADRKTLKVKPETKDRLDALKGDNDTTDAVLMRGFDALEAETDGGQDEIREVFREELQRFKDDLLSELRR